MNQVIPVVEDFSKYTLDQKTEEHIFNGDIARIRTSFGQTRYEISGGLHTYDGLIRFLDLRPDIKNLQEERDSIHNWYNISTNGNDVIFVRLPSSAFTKKSLKSLWASDLNFNSGYLYKTLFPHYLEKAEIIDLIYQVLNKPDTVKPRGWSTTIMSTVKLKNGSRIALTVYVDTNKKKILSAFPSFNQPIDSDSNNYALGLRRHSVFLSLQNPQVNQIREESDLLVPQFELMKQSMKRIKSQMDWNALSPEQKHRLLNNHVFANVNLSGRHIGGFDLSLRLNPDKFNYAPGEAYKFAGQILTYYLQDAQIDSTRKYELLKKLLATAVINDGSLFFDILWAKSVFGLILKSEHLFEKSLFENLILMAKDSPSFWTLFIPTQATLFGPKSSKQTANRLLHVMNDFYLEEKKYGGHDLDKSQLENLETIHEFYSRSWVSEFTFLKKLIEAESLNPDSKNLHIARKLLLDYINATILFLFNTRNEVNDPQDKIYLFGLKSHFNPEVRNLKKALSYLKLYSPDLDITFIFNLLYVFINGSQKTLERLKSDPKYVNNFKFQNFTEILVKERHENGINPKQRFFLQLYISDNGAIDFVVVIVGIEKVFSETEVPR